MVWPWWGRSERTEQSAFTFSTHQNQNQNHTQLLARFECCSLAKTPSLHVSRLFVESVLSSEDTRERQINPNAAKPSAPIARGPLNH